MGAEHARLVHRQALSQAEGSQPVGELSPKQNRPPAPAQDLSIAFDRVARAVRCTIALAQKLSEPVEAPAARSFQNGGSQRHTGARRRICAVEDTFQRDLEEKDPAKMTDAELKERIDALRADLKEDLDEDFEHDEDEEDDFEAEDAHRPVADIIADICRDLGITQRPSTHSWKRRLVADIAAVAARAATITSSNAPDSSAGPTSPTPKSVVPLRPHQPTTGTESADPP